MFAQSFFEFARQAGPGCRLRFAPSPSGFLHTGNALNFTLNWLVARLHGGHILLRIDDLDADRKREAYVADIFESLTWLGLDWDEGPGLGTPETALQDFEKHWSQHNRLGHYFDVLTQLRRQNRLFACRKSRSELAAFGSKYPPEFRHQQLSLDAEDVAWRLQCPPDSALGDFVVRRRDGLPAYQVASIADDVHFGITHIIRGEDLAASTAAQQYIASCLHDDTFLKIRVLHHPLILDATGGKLSKSAGATSLKTMREQGTSPAAVFNEVASMLGLAPVDSAATLLSSVKSRLILPEIQKPDQTKNHGQ